MSKIVINIGSAKSFRTPDGWKVAPDDRQSRDEIVGGVYVQDFGVVDCGETLSCQAIFDSTNWSTVKGYWLARTLVDVTDPDGSDMGNRRVVVKDYTRTGTKLHPHMYLTTLEFWKL